MAGSILDLAQLAVLIDESYLSSLLSLSFSHGIHFLSIAVSAIE